MPWETPTLRQVRERVRDDITGMLSGASVVGNTVLRVMADANAGLAHLTLRYIDWLGLQLLPDTAEKEWLDRHGDIWLINADETTGRKDASFSQGSVTLTGVNGTVVPTGTIMTGNLLAATTISYETLEDVVVGTGPSEVDVRAIDPGAAGNMDRGTILDLQTVIDGLDATAVVVTLDGGADIESDADLRIRVLERIRQPPMGGAQHDYVAWAKACAGVTRAWAAAEQGPGTVTVRFLMDELRVDETPSGWPVPADIVNVDEYIDTKRPVTVKDCYVMPPIAFWLDMTVTLPPELRAAERDALVEAIKKSVNDMLFVRAAPGQTIYRSWVSEAISEAVGEEHHELEFETTPMPAPGYMAVLGTMTFV